MTSEDDEYNNPGFHKYPPTIENVNNTKNIENKIWISLQHRDSKLDELEKVMDDVQAKIDTFRKLSFVNSPNEDSVYDPEDCLYDLETLDVKLFDYEELSKDFDLIIRPSTNNSGMILTTAGADDLVPLGRVFNILTSMLPNNVMLEIRTPPDKCTMLNLAVTHRGKLLCPNMNDRKPPDRDPSVVVHSDDCTCNSEIHKVILSNYGELPNNFDFMKISSSLVTYMTESSGMVNTTIKSVKIVSLDRV